MHTRGALAYQAIIGAVVPWQFLPGLATTVEYRFLGFAHRDYDVTVAAAPGVAAAGKLKFGNDFNHAPMIGVRYNFGAPAAPPPAAPAPAASRSSRWYQTAALRKGRFEQARGCHCFRSGVDRLAGFLQVFSERRHQPPLEDIEVSLAVPRQPDYRRIVGRRQVPREFEVRRRVHRPEQPGDDLCRQVAGVTSAHEYDVGDEGRCASKRPPNVTPERPDK